MSGAEQDRLDGPDRDSWLQWGPYLAERAWGTVREDYSADGDAWRSFPHDHARSRTYRWNEDGLGGICDDQQRLCFAFAFWNGADPILKERAFGLTGPEGNHGEDAKEYWWYVDSTPTHSWMRWRYAYPQRAFPYDDLVRTNAARGRMQPEYELLDTGVFDDDRYFDVVVDYAKAAAGDLCIRVRVTNRGPDAATLHLLPTLWFRDTWTWLPGTPAPDLRADGPRLVATDPQLGTVVLASDGSPEALCCENATNTERLWGDAGPAYPKDGIGDHVIHGSATVNPAGTGTKGALHHVLDVPAGATAEVHLRLRVGDAPQVDGPDWAEPLVAREQEADAFYGQLCAGRTADEAHVIRSALAGMLWSKQFYAYDVTRWLDGDPGQPAPPAGRGAIRNGAWRGFATARVVSMPDPWEYPWFAAWDLAFHCVTLANVDPAFAKQQLAMVIGDGWMSLTGQVPAYEWDFGAVNPPVHAWAALRIFRADGGTDIAWLRDVFERLIVNSTWWIDKNDPEDDGTFSGGFLGMDNVGPFDRGAALPTGFVLEQADATGWMALFALAMLEIATELSAADAAIEDMALRYFDQFEQIVAASVASGLWHEDDGFFYDQLVRVDEHGGDEQRWPVAVRSMSGLVPLFAVATVDLERFARLPRLRARLDRFLAGSAEVAAAADVVPAGDTGPALLALVDRGRLLRVLAAVGDPEELLGSNGIRSLSAAYRGRPFVFRAAADDGTQVDYEPAESTTPLFGGNSNWRGPVWFPVNALLLGALRQYAAGLGDELTVEWPRGSGRSKTIGAVADDLQQRLAALYVADASGRRTVWGDDPRFQQDPTWRDALLFFEYFDGDTGRGLGASHQTGWTGLVADVLLGRFGA